MELRLIGRIGVPQKRLQGFLSRATVACSEFDLAPGPGGGFVEQGNLCPDLTILAAAFAQFDEVGYELLPGIAGACPFTHRLFPSGDVGFQPGHLGGQALLASYQPV